MQRRFPVSYHKDFESALAAKKKIKEENPDKLYCIRRYSTRFGLMERLKVNEARVIHEVRSGIKYKKRNRYSSVL